MLNRTIAKAIPFGSAPPFNGDRFHLHSRSMCNTVRKGNDFMNLRGKELANGNKIHPVHDLMRRNTHSFSSIIQSIGDRDQLLVGWDTRYL